jgi:hypothetical protein
LLHRTTQTIPHRSTRRDKVLAGGAQPDQIDLRLCYPTCRRQNRGAWVAARDPARQRVRLVREGVGKLVACCQTMTPRVSSYPRFACCSFWARASTRVVAIGSALTRRSHAARFSSDGWSLKLTKLGVFHLLNGAPQAIAQIVDKFAVVHSEPRRIRDRDHVRFVAQQSCLVCGRKPCDPHHLRFAQNRTLGRKVSDEFTVPLCQGHHRELHRYGDEAAWWQKLGLDPTGAARALWLKSHPSASEFR